MPVWHLSIQAKMVEAPGTAPGSALLIPQHVYRHSWQTSLINIGAMRCLWKISFAIICWQRIRAEYPLACSTRDVAN